MRRNRLPGTFRHPRTPRPFTGTITKVTMQTTFPYHLSTAYLNGHLTRREYRLHAALWMLTGGRRLAEEVMV